MDGGVLNLLLFYLLLGLFCLPGYLAARGFHSAQAPRLFCLAAGFVYSLGMLAVIAWPCLWLRVSAELFWWIAAPYWVAITLAACASHRHSAVRDDIGRDLAVLYKIIVRRNRERGNEVD